MRQLRRIDVDDETLRPERPALEAARLARSPVSAHLRQALWRASTLALGVILLAAGLLVLPAMPIPGDEVSLEKVFQEVAEVRTGMLPAGLIAALAGIMLPSVITLILTSLPLGAEEPAKDAAGPTRTTTPRQEATLELVRAVLFFGLLGVATLSVMMLIPNPSAGAAPGHIVLVAVLLPSSVVFAALIEPIGTEREVLIERARARESLAHARNRALFHRLKGARGARALITPGWRSSAKLWLIVTLWCGGAPAVLWVLLSLSRWSVTAALIGLGLGLFYGGVSAYALAGWAAMRQPEELRDRFHGFTSLVFAVISQVPLLIAAGAMLMEPDEPAIVVAVVATLSPVLAALTAIGLNRSILRSILDLRHARSKAAVARSQIAYLESVKTP